MRCACIDIGSNTTRVLVAETRPGPPVALLERRAFTRIGRDLAPGGDIAPAKIGEVASVVAEQAREARDAGATAIRVVATAAIRGAGNRDALCAAIRSRAGLPVEILDGRDEARLAFLGATRTLGRPLDGVVAVLDVGGGSSELAVGTVEAGVTWSASLRIGSGALTDAHVRSDPPAASELAAIREQAASAFGPLDLPPCAAAVAVGGSAASLPRLVGAALDPGAMRRALEVLTGATCARVAERHGLVAERVRLLPAGILILDAAAARLGRSLEIGRGGLREGVCIELGARDQA